MPLCQRSALVMPNAAFYGRSIFRIRKIAPNFPVLVNVYERRTLGVDLFTLDGVDQLRNQNQRIASIQMLVVMIGVFILDGKDLTAISHTICPVLAFEPFAGVLSTFL